MNRRRRATNTVTFVPRQFSSNFFMRSITVAGKEYVVVEL